MKDGVRVLGEDGEVIAEFYGIKRRDNRLVVDGKALGVMRMDMILTPGELLRGARILFSWGVVSFVLLVPYFVVRGAFRRCLRSSKAGEEEKRETEP